MAMTSRSVTLPRRDLFGSRLRCLLLTHQPHDAVARLLTALVQPHGLVGAADLWKPRGFLEPAEARLVEVEGFLSAEQRAAVTGWWLEVSKGANTPNWDLASTGTVEGRRGLVLVEAKAHGAELSEAGKPAGNPSNDRSVGAAIQQASDGLNQVCPGWNLTADSHYQLANRFAWGWKLATLGVPVILVYLGFLHAEEMARQSEPFRSSEEWADAVRSHAHGVVPESAWDQRLEIDGTPFGALIRSMDLRWEPSGCDEGRSA